MGRHEAAGSMGERAWGEVFEVQAEGLSNRAYVKERSSIVRVCTSVKPREEKMSLATIRRIRKSFGEDARAWGAIEWGEERYRVARVCRLRVCRDNRGR
ncbi:unnamed protein product [Closterium sp. Yama58-4]|nr:unnamed protein product [Closterium sp. Yama58-4]